ncbi:methyltransferase domain-containing protein [uncultured Jatrophihabitans sp.]|uniref:class I SAM-dependent methyltransferase n=1 Tax=uncultured Jatrophihabitans sp. TaxID=1610747 RepID=UPI0035CBF074
MTARSQLSRFAHPAIERVTRPARERRFQQEFAAARDAGEVKVNIGAGRKAVPGWVNTDVVWQGRLYLDATSAWPVPAGSVGYIYADNVIEHVTLAQGREVFRHAFTALAPGGVFRLATPDVEAVARQYLENGELARLGMERNRERGRDFVHPVELLRQVYVGAQHYLGFIYDYAALSTEMEQAGFVVTRVRPGESAHAPLAGLEVRMHPAEEATALVVEGTKPA